ncbi:MULTISPECIES: LCP family glycopolymer transferase [Bacillus]|uniref:Trascriptional regulator n=2 Tax=Bacillus TaxID=1386 RepID=A0A0M4G741_9BACI|nr:MULTISPECIES: LCP family protein [Bacillus]ALC80790.1 trascriptional regulator [Bacillus gobiensis]MBP1079703.1 LCP family protein required for cell wall assembly [Bacillus capparidis]MED1095105.1 LCP family protein [Bacillus capparidis]
MGKKVLLFVLTFFTVVMLGTVSYAFQFVMSTSSDIHEDIDRNPKFEERLKNINFKDGDPISVLIMGLDSRPGEKSGRADSLILLTINPHSKSTHMVSIPRDTYTKIKGAAEDKINSSYQAGGTEMTIYSVENLLDVPVDYFVKVNFKSFEESVDALGGVEVNNDLDFTFENVHFSKGRLKLNGKEALKYARMRKLDPRGDFGRQKRQRQVIEALIQKGASTSSITKFGELVKVVEKNVKTNMTFNDMWRIQSNYKVARENIQQHKIEGSDKIIKGTYYYMPDKKELRKVSNNLKKHLELNGNDF